MRFRPTLFDFASIACACLSLFTARVSYGITYSAMDLGQMPGGSLVSAAAINSSGQVTGTAAGTLPVNEVAFRTQPGQPLSTSSSLGTLSPYSYGSGGSAINSAGTVVGACIGPGGADQAIIVPANSNTMQALGTFAGGLQSVAAGINNEGQVVGWSDTNSVFSHAFRTAPEGLVSDPGVDLGTFAGNGNSGATAINQSGQVTGESFTPSGAGWHAFRTTSTGKISDPGTDLGTLGGEYSEGMAINNSGEVVGWSYLADGQEDAFATTATGVITGASDLGTLPGGSLSEALGINNNGVIVGESTATDGYDAFVVYGSGPMIDLNTLIPANSGWHLSQAFGINDSGQIVGNGTLNGQDRSFVLTPVPEPGCAVIAVGVVGALMMCRRRFAR